MIMSRVGNTIWTGHEWPDVCKNDTQVAALARTDIGVNL